MKGLAGIALGFLGLLLLGVMTCGCAPALMKPLELPTLERHRPAPVLEVIGEPVLLAEGMEAPVPLYGLTEEQWAALKRLVERDRKALRDAYEHADDLVLLFVKKEGKLIAVLQQCRRAHLEVYGMGLATGVGLCGGVVGGVVLGRQ